MSGPFTCNTKYHSVAGELVKIKTRAQHGGARVVSIIWETEAGGRQVQAHPGQLGEILYLILMGTGGIAQDSLDSNSVLHTYKSKIRFQHFLSFP